jgi:hypothetical protein
MSIKLTKNLLTRDEAFALAPDYVKFVEAKNGLNDGWDKVDASMSAMKLGQACVTCRGNCGSKKGQYVRCKVSSRKPGFEGEPEIRVSNGELSWRVDGCDYAYPI